MKINFKNQLKIANTAKNAAKSQYIPLLRGTNTMPFGLRKRIAE